MGLPAAKVGKHEGMDYEAFVEQPLGSFMYVQ